ncbi:hypothetical protein KTT_00630 [Tengunoibacter tsumagoiensis]|uniref:ATP-binding protein n=1 Tax=Tengunoibacter tsumagoiensis TaxID=2014871 RepID=A0A401ZTW1_9CHLR|nr:hypothetical protein KTT_00630 [Tengunoibacter tsumagoiensis]
MPEEPAKNQPAQIAGTAHDVSIIVPVRTLIVLCGPAGAGKSTFARQFVKRHASQGYRQTTIVSSDYCRALISDDESSQHVNRDTFDLFYYIIHKRMFQGRLTIADSTAILPEARHKLLELAHRHQYQTCLIVFNIPLDVCLEHDHQIERGRIVGEKVIAYHIEQLQGALTVIPQEGWDQVYILDGTQDRITSQII